MSGTFEEGRLGLGPSGELGMTRKADRLATAGHLAVPR